MTAEPKGPGLPGPWAMGFCTWEAQRALDAFDLQANCILTRLSLRTLAIFPHQMQVLVHYQGKNRRSHEFSHCHRKTRLPNTSNW